MCNNSTIILKWSSLLGTSVMKKNIQKLREYARNHTTQVITKKKSNYMDEIDVKTFQKMKRRRKKEERNMDKIDI